MKVNDKTKEFIWNPIFGPIIVFFKKIRFYININL